MKASLSPNEAARLEALQQYQILDTAPEPEFDDLTYLAATICQTPMAAIVLIDHERQWFKSKIGLADDQTPRDVSICAHTIIADDLLVIADAFHDPRVADNPQVTSDPKFRFYAGVPLKVPGGHNIGTLCVLDTNPRQLSAEQQEALRRLGRQVVAQFEARPHQISDKARSRQQRLQAEKRLYESEQRYRRLFESASDGILIVDVQSGHIEDVNPAMCALSGYETDALLGKALWETDAFKSIASDAEALCALQQRGCGPLKDWPLVTRSGRVVPAECVCNAYEVENKSVIQFNIRDISERKQVEFALGDSENRFRFLNLLGDATRNLTEPIEIMAVTSRLLGTHLHASRCAYAEVKSGGDEFVIPSDYTDGCQSTAGKYHLSLFGPRACVELRANRTLVVNDVDAELTPATGAQMFNAIGIKAIICCPLVKNDELRAMMAIHQTTPRRWTPSEISLVEEAVERCWSFIERARAEGAVRRTEERRLMAVEAGGVGDWELDLVNNRLHWSEHARDLMGVPAGIEPDYELFLNALHSEDRERVAHSIDEALQPDSDGQFRSEFRVQPSASTCRWLHSRGQAIFENSPSGRHAVRFSGTLVDITERKQNAEALLERARLAELSADLGRALTRNDNLRAMLNRCADAITEHLDAAFIRIWTRNAGEDVLELQASAGLYSHIDGSHARVPVGQWKIGLIAQEQKPHFTNDVANDSRISNQEWAQREGIVSFAGYPLVVEDAVVGVLAMFARKPLSDVTLQALASAANSIALGIERKWSDEERAHLLESEQHARQHAENTNRIKDEFLSTVSHELRTPLTAILGWAHILKHGPLNEENTTRAVVTIERNARAQVQLIDALLDVSRIITGKLRLEVQPVELSEVIEAAIDAVRPAAEAKGIRLQMLLDPQAGLVAGDANRLQQIVWNLLTNAVKFTPKNGHVGVRLERVHSHLEIAVFDTGRGIEKEFLPHIFDRFRQADQTSTRAHGGLGLGLSIAHHLIELHGGTIEAHSEGAGQGTVFVVQLPRMVTVQSDFTTERRHPTAGTSSANKDTSFDCPPQLNQLRVLIVDDEADTRELLRAVLMRCGSQVQTAASVAEAIELFQQWQPAVLISDIGMPERDGYELIAQVREWESHHGGRVPAIALTAYARVEDRVRALRAGFQVHVPKPVEPIELIAVVASLAGRQEK